MPNIWLSHTEIMSKPTTGKAWTAMKAAANKLPTSPVLKDNNSLTDTSALAAAIVCTRTKDTALQRKLESHLAKIPNVSLGDVILPVARNLCCYAISADIIGYRTSSFLQALNSILLTHKFAKGHGGSETVLQMAQQSTNNHGCMARASALAVALFLNRYDLAEEVLYSYRSWLGSASYLGTAAYHDLVFTDTNWHADSRQPIGINSRGASRNGRSIDGVLPEDQRRNSEFKWPPPKENYVYGAMGPTLVALVLGFRANMLATNEGDWAVMRAYQWLFNVCRFMPEGDDVWQLPLLKKAYPSTFSNISYTSPCKPGKVMAWTDWSHA